MKLFQRIFRNVASLCDYVFHFVGQSISPGVVNTEIFESYQLEENEKQNYPLLTSSDISNAVLYVLGTPPHVQVSFLFTINRY